MKKIHIHYYLRYNTKVSLDNETTVSCCFLNTKALYLFHSCYQNFRNNSVFKEDLVFSHSNCKTIK